MYYSEYIKEVRKEKGMTQAEFSEAIGLSLPALKNIEQHRVDYPTNNIINKLSVLCDRKPIEIVNSILFGDIEGKYDDNVLREYLSYMYLDGWNIEEYPYIPREYKYDRQFLQAKIVKKRDPKNIVIVNNYQEFKKECKENHIDALKNMLISFAMLYDQYRAVHIVFGSNDTDSKNDFDIIKDIRLNKMNMEVRIVLFDTVEMSIEKACKINLKTI